MNAKKILLGEERVPGSEKITALNLSVYCSAEVATIEDGRAYFLVGDAAFGVPFFRALNNGLMCGSKLAHSLAEVGSSWWCEPIKHSILTPINFIRSLM